MGLGHFLDGVGDAVENTAKIGGAVAEHVLNPTKWDNAARFIGDHGDDIAKVGWDIAKDQINPMKADFWINAGTLALSAATGGAAAAPLLAARTAMAAKTASTVAKTVEVGSAVAKGAEAASVASKAVQTADKVADAARVVDKVGDVARVADTANTATKLGRVQSLVQGANEVSDAGSMLGKFDKTMDFLSTNRTAQAVTKGREALGMGKLGPVTQARVGMANKIMQAGGEAPSIGRKMAATAMAGQKGVKPSLRVGEAASHAGVVQDTIWQGQRLTRRAKQVQNTATGVDVMANPEQAAMDYASKEFKGAETDKTLRQPQRATSSGQNMSVGAPIADTALSTSQSNYPAVGMKANYSSGRGFSAPVQGGTSSVVGQRELTTSVRDPYVNGSVSSPRTAVGALPNTVHDPYSNSQGESQTPGSPYKVRDPYKALSQPKGY